MTLSADNLEQRFQASPNGLSARRLWEHTELGQINAVEKPINSRAELNEPAEFIDVVRFEGGHYSLTGATLADLTRGKLIAGKSGVAAAQKIIDRKGAAEASKFMDSVQGHLDLCAARQAIRNQHHRFLPPARSTDALGVHLIFSALQRKLSAMGGARAQAGQWVKTIENLRKKGLREEELHRSGLLAGLHALEKADGSAAVADLLNLCRFNDLRLSVIPVVSDAQRQLRFTGPTSKKLKRTLKLPKAQAGQVRNVERFDPVLGYRLEQIEHQTLWGPEQHWQAVTYEGEVIRYVSGKHLFPTVEGAEALAAAHAKMHFPKRLALGRWRQFAWTGGEAYREWLITLPHFPGSFFSSHFVVRNVLAHVRCDIREGVDGMRVLLLHEVQSDWAQIARRAVSDGEMSPNDPAYPPFLKEWSALALKLMLLHATTEGLDAVAWTQGVHQAARYKGLGATGLAKLYDSTLPADANRMMKPMGGACETLGVYVPANFSIKQTENGYEVYTAENLLLATAPTLEDARQFVPDGAHELLFEVHGVRLTATIRRAILDSGFPAWG